MATGQFGTPSWVASPNSSPVRVPRSRVCCAPSDPPHELADVSSPIFQSLLPLYALLLLPSFHYLWLSSGTGNANFFYAGTLVWAIAMGGWSIEAIKAKGKRELLVLQEEEGRRAWREGKWKLVQR